MSIFNYEKNKQMNYYESVKVKQKKFFEPQTIHSWFMFLLFKTLKKKKDWNF